MFIRNINLHIDNETLNFKELAQFICIAFGYLDYQPGVDNRKATAVDSVTIPCFLTFGYVTASTVDMSLLQNPLLNIVHNVWKCFELCHC